MKRFLRSLLIFFLSCPLISACMSNASDNLDTDYHDLPPAQVNGEIFDEKDFEITQTWMPAFARQLESNSSLEINRFWSLLRIMIMAQEARNENLLSEAERSLAIKEALAKKNIESIPFPEFTITPEEIDAWMAANPDKLVEPDAFTVNYALIKSEKKIMPLIAALGLSNGAQMGYNYIDPPESAQIGKKYGPNMSNEGGHHMDAKRFDFAFTTYNRENTDEPAQLGPFTENDGLLFSCPEAIQTLKSAPLRKPLTHSIACSGTWKAFVIPVYHRAAAQMTGEKARQVATDALIKSKRDAFQNQYIQQKLSETPHQNNI